MHSPSECIRIVTTPSVDGDFKPRDAVSAVCTLYHHVVWTLRRGHLNRRIHKRFSRVVREAGVPRRERSRGGTVRSSVPGVSKRYAGHVRYAVVRHVDGYLPATKVHVVVRQAVPRWCTAPDSSVRYPLRPHGCRSERARQVSAG